MTDTSAAWGLWADGNRRLKALLDTHERITRLATLTDAINADAQASLGAMPSSIDVTQQQVLVGESHLRAQTAFNSQKQTLESEMARLAEHLRALAAALDALEPWEPLVELVESSAGPA